MEYLAAVQTGSTEAETKMFELESDALTWVHERVTKLTGDASPKNEWGGWGAVTGILVTTETSPVWGVVIEKK